ncbi:MAG: hypothetical protein QMD44_09975 [Thermodesulfovibrionales bacterium]|jgi:hypothetical protein|nr:hypothetical protein [Thermodesulfovibrionales bacterium]
MKAKKKIIVLAVMLLLAFLTMPLIGGLKTTQIEVSLVSVAHAEDAKGFKWIPRRPGITRAQIALGRAVTIPFEFTVTGNVKKVRFELPKKFTSLGIDILEDEVAVKGGKASSAVLFTVPPGKPLGKFDMVVTAKDAATGKEIGKGTIPFMLLPPGVGGC